MKSNLGPDHPDTLIMHEQPGTGTRPPGSWTRPCRCSRRRCARKAKLGPDHPDTLISMNNLAAGYWSMKRLDKSVPLFEEVLKLEEEARPRPSETLHDLANLGVNYKDAGRLKEAIPLLEEAHQAAKNSQSFAGSDGQLLDAYMKAGENAKLADLLQEQLAEARKTLPKDSPQLAGLLAQIGLGLLKQKKWTEAEPLLRECLAIREKTQPDVWSTFNTQSLLGGARWARRNTPTPNRCF